MDYEQVIERVLKSHRSNWERIDDDCFVDKNEVLLCIKNEGVVDHKLQNKWAIMHSEYHAYAESYKLYYSNIPMKEIILVTVADEAKIPLPEQGTNEIKDLLAYKIATIVSEKCDEYIEKSGLKNCTQLVTQKKLRR